MLKKKFATILFVLLASTVAFGFQQAGQGDVTWQKFSSREGRFSVLMPAPPRLSSRDVDTDFGKITLYVYDLSSSPGYLAAMYSDYPMAARDAAQANKVLDSVRDGVLSGAHGKLITEKKITVKGHPGREFTASGAVQGIDVIFTWRLYLVERRLYQLAVGAPANDSKDPNIARFLTSFELLAGASASQ